MLPRHPRRGRAIGLLLGLALLGLPAGAHASALKFHTVKLADAAGGTEPRIASGPDGRYWIVTNEKATGNGIVYSSADKGRTWDHVEGTIPGQTMATIDTDIVAMPDGRILASELDFAGINFPTAVSDDGGRTWTASRGSNTLVDQDRQWFAYGPKDPSTGKHRVYMLFHNLGSGFLSHNMWVATSTDGGETFGVPVPTTLPGDDAFLDLQCADSGGPGSIAVNEKTGRIYAFFTTRSAPLGGGCGASVFGPIEANIVASTRLWVATSPDGSPGSWTQSLAVDDSESGRIVSMQVGYGTVDNAGNVWVAYPESPRPYPDYSGAAVRARWADPDLKTWSKPIEIAPEGGPGHIVAHIAAGDPGKISLAYYTGEPGGPDGKPTWHTEVAQSLDAMSDAPHVERTAVSEIPAYVGTASELMGACGSGPAQGIENGFLCNRSTDVWGIATDVKDCRTIITWPTVENDAKGADSGTFASVQDSGRTLCGTTDLKPKAKHKKKKACPKRKRGHAASAQAARKRCAKKKRHH